MRKKSTKLAPALALLGLLGLGPGFPAEEGRLEYVGSALWSKAYDVEVRDNLVYCAFLNGLMILDITDPKKPVALSRLYLAGGFGLALRENLVFVAAGDKGLKIVDVTDPKAPVLKASCQTGGEAKDVAVSGLYAYVAEGSAGLEVFEVSAPSAPRLISSWDSPGQAGGILVRGDYAYLADGQAGMQILSIRDPASLKLVGSLDTEGNAEDIALSGNTAYVADGSSGLQVIDVSNPSRPQGLASLTTSGYAHSVACRGKCLLVGNLYDGGYQIIDTTNEKSPAILTTGRYTMYNEAWEVALSGQVALVVDYFSGIYIIDISDQKNPAPLGIYSTPSSVTAALVQGHYAYVVGEITGLLALDISNPRSPQTVGSFGLYRGVQGLAVSGHFAYMTDRWSIKIFDISRPDKISLARTFAIPKECRGPSWSGRTWLI